ncbi:MAG: hypothetical protein M0R17_02515 [Candidatus Omnitrophica bacterium]|jgi:hypothetical protein|nr:hypothetical protein [Candidatus Omnitrophota bacterium]
MSIEIIGEMSGLGVPDYYLNLSRRQAFNPQLICDDQPYLPGDCPIVTIEYDGFSPNKIINIKSLENSVYQNTLDYHKIETITYDGYTYPLKYYEYVNYNDKLSYLITDYNSDPSNSNPLFYQYELLFDAYVDISGVSIKNIYKNNEIKLDQKEYKIQYSVNTLALGNLRYSNTSWLTNTINQNNYRIRILLPFYISSKDNFYIVEYEKYINNIKSYQKELIEIEPIYTTNDYEITNSGVILSVSSKIQQSNQLSIVKNPFKRITPLDIVTLKDKNSYLTDKDTQWKLRINTGAFAIPSGLYTSSSGYLYNLENFYTSGNIPVTNIKPIKINKNIVQIKETPIYLNSDDYIYPYYDVKRYDNNLYDLYDVSGKFDISINGKSRSDIKIKSIDRYKGFIEFNKEINNLDEVELSFYLTNSDTLILENLELNPKVSQSGVLYHINNYPNGFGIALKAWSGIIQYPYIYDLNTIESDRIVSGIIDVGSSTYISGMWDDTYLSLCKIDLNNLSSDIVKRTDTRRVGGGLIDNKTLDVWFNNNFSGVYINEKSWYSNVAKYNGEPISNSSIIIINIPQEHLDTLKLKWFNYYKEFMTYDEAEITSEREFNYYLDSVIRKNISAGSDYIIIPNILDE